MTRTHFNWYITCPKYTVSALTDSRLKILNIAPVCRRFTGQSLTLLIHWLGRFGEVEALPLAFPGPIPNGTRVRKCNSTPGDGHPDGALATILSHKIPGTDLPAINITRLVDAPYVYEPGTWAYIVEWDGTPGVPVAIVGTRLEVVL